MTLDPPEPLAGRVVVLAAATLLAGACDSGGAGPRIEVRDSAGVTIVESRLPEDARLPWRVGPEPFVTIGSPDGPEPYQLYRVMGATRLSDGSIAVANAGTGQLRVYGPDGVFLGAAGGEGGGPGEFRSMTLVGRLPADSVLLYDGRARRFSVMAPGPAFARSFGPGAGVGEGSVAAVGVPGTGDIAVQGPSAFPENLAGGTIIAPSRPLMVLGPDGGLRAVLDTLPTRPTLFESDGGFSFTLVPFTTGPALAVGGDRIHVAPERRYEVRTYDPRTGGLVRLTRLEREPRLVTDEDIARTVEAAVDRADGDEAGARLRRSYEAMELPNTMPAHGRLLVDRPGNLWVEEFRAHGDEPHVWTVFDPDGAVRGTVELPPDLYVFEIGPDWILGVARDELDIPYVVLHGLERPTTE